MPCSNPSPVATVTVPRPEITCPSWTPGRPQYVAIPIWNQYPHYYAVRIYYESTGCGVLWNPSTMTIRVVSGARHCKYGTECRYASITLSPGEYVEYNDTAYAPQWLLDLGLQQLQQCQWTISDPTSGGFQWR